MFFDENKKYHLGCVSSSDTRLMKTLSLGAFANGPCS